MFDAGDLVVVVCNVSAVGAVMHELCFELLPSRDPRRWTLRVSVDSCGKDDPVAYLQLVGAGKCWGCGSNSGRVFVDEEQPSMPLSMAMCGRCIVDDAMGLMAGGVMGQGDASATGSSTG